MPLRLVSSLIIAALFASPALAQDVFATFGKDAAASAKEEQLQPEEKKEPALNAEQQPGTEPAMEDEKKLGIKQRFGKEPAPQMLPPEGQVDPDVAPVQAEDVKPKGGLGGLRAQQAEQISPRLNAGGLAARAAEEPAEEPAAEPAAAPAEPPPCPEGQYRPSSIGECFDIPVERADPPCPEGQIRMSTGGECVVLPADGSSPHDHAIMPYDPELRCADFAAQRQAADGTFYCEAPTLTCPDFQVARPTPSGWRCEAATIPCTAPDVARPTPHGWMCESPTIECPEGQHAQAIPTGWSCEPGAGPAPRAVEEAAPPPPPPAECPVQFTRAADGSCVPPAPCPEAGHARNRRGECVPVERAGDE